MPAAPSAGALTAIMTGVAYATSAEMAGEAWALPRLREQPRAHAARHPQSPPRRLRRARPATRRSSTPPVPLDHAALPGPDASIAARQAAWDRALELGEKHGYRNAQATVIAPTGTIGLVMDCDTTGIEPDFALVKFKKLAGGGYFKIINRAVPEALAHARLHAKQNRRDRGLRGRPRHAGAGARRSTTPR